MWSLLGPALGIINEFLKGKNIDKVQKYLDSVNDLKLKIDAEWSKGYDLDNAALEMYYGQLKIALESLQTQYNLHGKS